MGFHQYHEPPEELSQKTRTFAGMTTSLIEEAEALGWYEQRISLEKDKDAKTIMENAHRKNSNILVCIWNFCFAKSRSGELF